MSKRRRRILSNTCYEICFRAKNTLPFVTRGIIKLVVGAAVARTQRDDKVILSHDIWNGSHCHMIIVAKDSKQCVNFYSEIQKKITDLLKRLVGLDHLEIWEGYPMVAEIADLEAAKERVSYLYANPAQDNLVECIDKYPGYSSWNQFLNCLTLLNAQSTELFPWIRLPSVPKLRSLFLTQERDRHLVSFLVKKNKERNLLVRSPNEWMRCFGIETDDEVKEINQEIIERLRRREREALKQRKADCKQVMGISKLCSQPILKSHKPKKRERKIFVLASVKSLRIKLIQEFKEFCALCRQCYLSWSKGMTNVQWPPGAFRPPLSPTCNILPVIR